MTSILNLDARYTISQEFLSHFYPEWVIRLDGAFILSHDNEAVAKNLARVHSGMKGN